MLHRNALCLLTTLIAAGAPHAAEPAPSVPTPSVPLSIRTPAGAELVFSSKITGAQIYTCAKKGDAYEWQFKAPDGDMADVKGETMGRHFAGPSWSLNDGSEITGEVLAKAPAPNAADIPWLLLKTKSAGGAGRLADIAYVQRLQTQGGIAPVANVPANDCDAAKLGSEHRSAYSAQYYFYKERSAPAVKY